MLFQASEVLQKPYKMQFHKQNVWDIAKLTNMQYKHMKNTIQNTKTMETSQLSMLTNSQISTVSSEDSHARVSQLLETVKDLTIQEAHYFLKSQGLLKRKDRNI